MGFCKAIQYRNATSVSIRLLTTSITSFPTLKIPTLNQLAVLYYFKFITNLNSLGNPLIKQQSSFSLHGNVRKRLKRQWPR